MKQIYFLLAMLAVSLSMSAQVQNAVLSAQMPDNQAIVLSPCPFAAMEQQRQNAYKGSIFTKAPFFTVDFSDTNEFSVGWTSGVGYHTAAYSHWNRLPDNTAATQNAYNSVFPSLFHISVGNVSLPDFNSPTSNDGIMVMSMIDADNYGSSHFTNGKFDSWLAIKGVSVPSSSSIYDVSFYQWYRCSYWDSCFLEYSHDSINWNRIYINRKGIDIANNSATLGYKTVSLPQTVSGYQNLYVRLRWRSDSATGYQPGWYWLVDDIGIEQAANNRMEVVTNAFYDGGYHLVPQGMGGNDLFWQARFRNNGRITQTNVKGIVKASNGTVLAQSQNMASILPDAVNDTFAKIDPEGRFADIWGGSAYQYGTSSPLPSTNQGVDSIFVSLISDSLAIPVDTFLYNVNCDSNGNRVWGRDNGVLTSSDYFVPNILSLQNWCFPQTGFTVKYRTPSTVPSNWVIRGVEIVASPNRNMPSGAILEPYLAVDSTYLHVYTTQNPLTGTIDTHYNTGACFINQHTGAGDYTVQASDITLIDTGYRAFGTYNTIRISFPLQPALIPDTSYWIGYTVTYGTGTFYPALSTNWYYDMDSATMDTVRRRLPGLLGNEFGGGDEYNVFNLDFWDSHAFYSMGQMCVPMIRMIVGPRQQIPNYNITWNVVPAYGGFVFDMTDNSNVTGRTISKPQGSTTMFGIEENYDEYDIFFDSIVVNGVPVDYNNDPDFGFGQGCYTYKVTNLQQNTDCVVYFVRCGVNSHSDVVVKLQPNPATTSASLTIEGVYGQVEYSLIDINGRTVQSETIDANATHRLNLKGLTRGTYFVRITNDRFTKVEKLIVR